MNKIASLTFYGTLLFSFSASANADCPDATRAASAAAQDYRQAVGKVRAACDSSVQTCDLSRAKAEQMLSLLNEANRTVSEVCVFTLPPVDDSLPVSVATVAAAIDTFATSVLIPCNRQGTDLLMVEIGCPNGWTLNIPRSNVAISQLTATQFSYSGLLNASGSVPIRYETLGSGTSTCTLGITTATPVQVAGSADFLSSSSSGILNRLQLGATSVSNPNIQLTGCGAVSAVLDVAAAFLQSTVTAMAVSSMTGTFCGVQGPELFGTCP